MLVPTAASSVALGVLLFVAGTAIAPTYAAIYAMVDRAAPPGTMTEAFAWLATAVGIGAAAGAAGAGVLAEHAGPKAAFALAGAAGVVAVLGTTTRSSTLPSASDGLPPKMGRPAHQEPRSERGRGRSASPGYDQ